MKGPPYTYKSTEMTTVIYKKQPFVQLFTNKEHFLQIYKEYTGNVSNNKQQFMF